MKPRFKRKDWMGVIIGVLTVLLGAGGVFMPEWVNKGKLEEWQAYVILAVLVLLIITCLVVLQRDVRRAEAEHEEREREQQEREKGRDKREKESAEREMARDEREAKRDELFRELFLMLSSLMDNRGEHNTRRYTQYREAERHFDKAVKQKREEDRIERAVARGDILDGTKIVIHGVEGIDSGSDYLRMMAPPIGSKYESLDQLRDQADAKVRAILDEYKKDVEREHPN